MRIMQPYTPLCVKSENLHHTVHSLCSDYTFGPDGLITSIRSQGTELLAEPVRIVSLEEGKPSEWDNDYYENESESFIQRRLDEQVIICGAKQSERFIIDTCSQIEYDGNVKIDLKLMPVGFKVTQLYGDEKYEQKRFLLDKLWLEIPLRKDIFKLYNISKDSDIKFADGEICKATPTSASGKLPEKSFGLPFQPFMWLGNEERGLGWFAENHKNWQPGDEASAVEVEVNDKAIILRIRLIDGQPKPWNTDPTEGMFKYHPIEFSFGLQATPVKPFPKQPYIHNAFHLDCGIKIKGNYGAYLSTENRFDRLKEKGVTTLILHEKWNKCQNWFELSEFTGNQLKFICDECHKRGIKVLPYFGYEISVLSPVWTELKDSVTDTNSDGETHGGWWRVPFQRDYVACYRSEYSDYFIKGITKLMDTYHIDGVYLDGTIQPKYCQNTAHGCGWYDYDGKLQGSYPIIAVRELLKKLYEVVESRGGEVNVHSPGIVNFTALPYVHQTWYGEVLQLELQKDTGEDMKLDYFRAEYIGRNMGVPVEFIAYEKKPEWTFEQAIAMSILHGILPRPNDIGHPLDLMSDIWNIFDKFPIEKSEWKPYWNNEVYTSNEKLKVSYYEYTAMNGKKQALVFAVNISASDINNVKIGLYENALYGIDLTENKETELTFDLGRYGYKILFIQEV